MQTASRFQWRLTLAALAGVCIGGAAIVVALAGGVANPPRGAPVMALDAPDSALPAEGLPLPALPPFTIEVSATHHGDAGSAWGLRVGAADDQHIFVIDDEGYFSVSSDEARHWQEFIHLRPDSNTLHLHVDADGSATFRINGEIAWRGVWKADASWRWGIAADEGAGLEWDFARLYAG